MERNTAAKDGNRLDAALDRGNSRCLHSTGKTAVGPGEPRHPRRRREIDAPEGPKTPLAEEREIIPLVLAARATGVHAVRGVWHSAAIRLTPDGLCRIAANWQREPVFRDGTPPTADEIAADLARIRAARAGWSRGCTRQDNSERRVTRRRRTASQHDCPVAAAFGGFRHRFASRTRATFRNRDST